MYADAFSPCFPSALRYRVQKDPITGKARVIDTGLAEERASPWGWAVCHAGGFVHRRHHYVWCVGEKRHHLGAVRWVKSEHKVGFVPIHPYDVKGRPPVNRKGEVYAVNNKNGLVTGTGQIRSRPPDWRSQVATPGVSQYLSASAATG